MTAQVPEVLRIDGEEYGMCDEPLGVYFGLGGKNPGFVMGDTALWRGYVGEWEVVDKRLYLVKLEGYLEGSAEASLATVFPAFPDRVFAHWFSGTVRIPQGETLKYVHMGYESVYERDLFLSFEKGVLTGSRVVENGVAGQGSLEDE